MIEDCKNNNYGSIKITDRCLKCNGNFDNDTRDLLFAFVRCEKCKIIYKTNNAFILEKCYIDVIMNDSDICYSICFDYKNNLTTISKITFDGFKAIAAVKYAFDFKDPNLANKIKTILTFS